MATMQLLVTGCPALDLPMLQTNKLSIGLFLYNHDEGERPFCFCLDQAVEADATFS